MGRIVTETITLISSAIFLFVVGIVSLLPGAVIGLIISTVAPSTLMEGLLGGALAGGCAGIIVILWLGLLKAGLFQILSRMQERLACAVVCSAAVAMYVRGFQRATACISEEGILDALSQMCEAYIALVISGEILIWTGVSLYLQFQSLRTVPRNGEPHGADVARSFLEVFIRKEGSHDGQQAALREQESWNRTPLDGMFDESTESLATLGNTLFDVFVSYKVEDVNVARWIAEQMLSAGYRVWHAEYAIPLERQRAFADALATGLRRSRRGVIVTSELYLSSEWTRYELKELLHLNTNGPGNLVEVQLQGGESVRKQFPKLLDVPVGLHQEGLDHVLGLLRTSLDLPDIPTAFPTAASNVSRYTNRALGYGLTLDGWTVVRQEGGWVPFVGHYGPAFEAVMAGYSVRGTLLVGRVPFTRRATSQETQEEYVQSIYSFARRYMQMTGGKVVGVHRFIHRGMRHSAITYWKNGDWMRKYSIDLPDPKDGNVMEFAFTFSFRGPFQMFCRHACLFDRVVASLNW